MRIAQVSPLYESVPPRLYGGTERVISYLTEELVRLGHEVTLFASGDSVTSARLVASCSEALRMNKNCVDPLAHHIVQMQELIDRANEFDIIHFHVDYLHFNTSRLLNLPHITTLHGRLDIPDLIPVYQKFARMPVVSISNHQRRPLPFINWRGTVYNGLPGELYSPGTGEKGYAAFLGRISPEKRVDRAIYIAKKAGLPIKIAAKIDKVDQDYFENHIAHLLNDPSVEFVGEIGEDQKGAFLGGAVCLLFPIDWPEPFGMVMVEAMANGTPVIAYRNGSVPEVIDEGETGYIIQSVGEAANAIGKLHLLDRGHIREVFETRFSAEKMAENYLEIYSRVIESRPDQSLIGYPTAG